MDIFSVFSLIGGLAFFLYGMHVMSTGLEKLAGGKLEHTLKKMTSNKFSSILLGAGITIAIQSSSAMTVMLVGLVNSGIMQLGQTIGVIMGSNIGTTLTPWIISLSGIESESFFVSLLKPENFSPIIAMAGIAMIMASNSKRKKDIGNICVGFSVLMYGMKLMSGAVSPLADIPEFSAILTAFSNPIVGVAVGTIFTGIIQSSAASVGILQALSLTGSLSYRMAIPIIMGQNIGTCVTALLSSIGVTKNAKRVAIVHITFNIIGTVVCLSLFYGASAIFDFLFIDKQVGPVGIAAVHSIFNISTTLMLLPFSKQLELIANHLIKDSSGKEKYTFIDERLLRTPSFAISESLNMVIKMSDIATGTVLNAISLFDKYDKQVSENIMESEKTLDRFEDKLGTYLLKLSSKDISDADSKQISKMFLTIGDFERLGDHAVNLKATAEEFHEKNFTFSEEAQHESKVLTEAIKEIILITAKAFAENNIMLASNVEPLEQVIDSLVARIRENHVERLQRGECTIQKGFVYADMLSNYSRISDHCSNIAAAVIGASHNSFDTHKYLGKVKSKTNEEFMSLYNSYFEKYAI
ncbi:MAG: Na/Pi cotransporter family protein [Lachnospiraceae bacterium]|nr:Na/Pi cotransporter family protein [Lachnospiraceae bacterium]